MRGTSAKYLQLILWTIVSLAVANPALADDRIVSRAEQFSTAADLRQATGLGDWHLAMATDQSVRESNIELTAEETAAELASDAAPVQHPPLSSELALLRDRVRRVLGVYYRRQLSSNENTPWEMMHGIIAYGVETQIRRAGTSTEPVNAISYVCRNGPCRGLQLLYLDRGRINARKGPYVQGHYGQFLAILAQSRVPRDYPLRAEGKSFTVEDLLATEKLTCATGIELTFKLISIAHYCDLDATWKNEKGETWSIPRLIAEELKSPILNNAACGGTHRLTALAYAVHNRQAQGKSVDGQWLAAKKYLDQYHQYTLALQNKDGSFSTEWFRRRDARPDIDRRLQTTGHILEWIVYSLPADDLDDPRVVRAVNYLSGLLLNKPNNQWEIGPLGHAIHALSIYDHRVFKPHDAPAADVASSPSDLTVTRYNADGTPQVETNAGNRAPIYQTRIESRATTSDTNSPAATDAPATRIPN